MANGYWKDLLIKAGWAAIYGAIAEFATIQHIDKNTLYVALASAGARAIIIFVSTIKDAVSKPTTAAKSVKTSTWKSRL